MASPPRPSGEDAAAAGEILRAAAASGWPVQTHAVTTEGLDMVLYGYQDADRVRPIGPLRWSVTHAEGITPAQLDRARRLGVMVQLRSQSVIGNQRAAQINPFITLWWAVTGRCLGGDVVLDEPISREQALVAHTRSNAKLMFRENHLGSIRPGLLADLVVLDRDYLTVPEGQIRDIRPVATIVGGKVVYGAL